MRLRVFGCSAFLAVLLGLFVGCSNSPSPTSGIPGRNNPTSTPLPSHSAVPTSTASPTPTGTWATFTPTVTDTPGTPTSTPTPYPTTAWAYGGSAGQYGTDGVNGDFDIPMGVAVGPDYIAVSDEGTENVQVFDLGGNYLYSIPPHGGSANADLYGMTMDSNDELYVVDYGNSEVDGYYLEPHGYAYDYTWTGQGTLSGPTGVRIDSGGNLVVADYGSGQVYNLAWTDDSVLNQTVGGPTMGPGDVALDAAGDVFALDYDGAQVVEFDSNYNYVNAFNGSGWTTPLGANPYSLDFDSQGNLFISDPANGRIVYATPQGGYLGEIDAGTVPYDYYYLAFDSYDDLFVADGTGSQLVQFAKQ